MRHGQARLVDHDVAVQEQVEVDRARPPVGLGTLASELALDLEETLEQRARLELGLELRDGVQEPRLIRVAPRLGLTDRRKPHGVDPLGGLQDHRLTVPEIRAEPDVRASHGRLTVTALNSTGSPAGRTSGFRTRTRVHSGWNRSISVSATALASASSRSWRCSLTSRIAAATSV